MMDEPNISGENLRLDTDLFDDKNQEDLPASPFNEEQSSHEMIEDDI